MKNNPLKIFLVDDDVLLLKSMEMEFHEKTDYAIQTFATGELCIANLAASPDLIVLDYQLDGIEKNAMNGIATLDAIKAIDQDIPVIILSSQDKIEVAVKCMRHYAFDYVVKSETAFLRLQKLIDDIVNYRKMERELNWYMKRM